VYAPGRASPSSSAKTSNRSAKMRSRSLSLRAKRTRYGPCTSSRGGRCGRATSVDESLDPTIGCGVGVEDECPATFDDAAFDEKGFSDAIQDSGIHGLSVRSYEQEL